MEHGKQTTPDRPDRDREHAEDLFAIQETLRGRRDAFESIVERYTPLLYSLAYRMLATREEAEEAVQEILIKTYRSLRQFRLHRRFHPWIYTIALNHLRSCQRKARRKGRSNIVAFDELILQSSVPAGEAGPEELAQQGEGERLAAAAIRALRSEYREVFLLRQVEGLSVAEVSEILELPEGTVKTYLHRARRELIELLAGEGFG